MISQQQKRVSSLETELKTKDSEHGTLRTKLEQLQVHILTCCSHVARHDLDMQSEILHVSERFQQMNGDGITLCIEPRSACCTRFHTEM